MYLATPSEPDYRKICLLKETVLTTNLGFVLWKYKESLGILLCNILHMCFGFNNFMKILILLPTVKTFWIHEKLLVSLQRTWEEDFLFKNEYNNPFLANFPYIPWKHQYKEYKERTSTWNVDSFMTKVKSMDLFPYTSDPHHQRVNELNWIQYSQNRAFNCIHMIQGP